MLGPRLYLHSVVDVITNSSTEMFIYNGKDSVAKLTEMLENVLAAHNQATGESRTFDEVFRPVRKATKEDVRMLKDYEAVYALANCHVGKTSVVKGASDNSIPYEAWGYLERLAGFAGRLHIG